MIKYFLPLLFLPVTVFAQGVSDHLQIFSIYPAKQEITVSPGETVIKRVSIENNLKIRTLFNVFVVDVAAGDDSPVKFFEDEDIGPYSLKRFIDVSDSSFYLEPGESRQVVLGIQLPAAALPGGLYGAIIVSSELEDEGAINAKVVSRIASLLFITVPGDVVERGKIIDFGVLGKKFKSQKDVVRGQVTYQNTGGIYLNPYGFVEVLGMFGGSVWQKEVDPWYVFPDSTRLLDFTVDKDLGVGFYRLKGGFNLGFQDRVIAVNDWFIVLPSLWVIILIGVLIFIAFAYLVLKFRIRWRK